jgi:hypothetical protein
MVTDENAVMMNLPCTLGDGFEVLTVVLMIIKGL